MANIDRIVINWTGKCFEVPSSLWQNQPLPETIAGDARVCVRRGAVIADIPSDVPFGTFCILVNLASIK
jgi:hypothetical protein